MANAVTNFTTVVESVKLTLNDREAEVLRTLLHHHVRGYDEGGDIRKTLNGINRALEAGGVEPQERGIQVLSDFSIKTNQ